MVSAVQLRSPPLDCRLDQCKGLNEEEEGRGHAGAGCGQRAASRDIYSSEAKGVVSTLKEGIARYA